MRVSALTYEEVMALAADCESRLSEWIKHLSLALEPDEAAVNRLLIDFQREYLLPHD